MGLIIFLVIGALAGWLAGTLMKGRGFGLLGNIFVGIVGAVIGGFMFDLLGRKKLFRAKAARSPGPPEDPDRFGGHTVLPCGVARL